MRSKRKKYPRVRRLTRAERGDVELLKRKIMEEMGERPCVSDNWWDRVRGNLIDMSLHHEPVVFNQIWQTVDLWFLSDGRL